MNTLDIVAALASGSACVTYGLRANMLKPMFNSWVSAPTFVWLPLVALSIILGANCWSIVRTGVHATPREVILLVALAVSSLCMLVNLNNQTSREHNLRDAQS